MVAYFHNRLSMKWNPISRPNKLPNANTQLTHFRRASLRNWPGFNHKSRQKVIVIAKHRLGQVFGEGSLGQGFINRKIKIVNMLLLASKDKNHNS